MQLLDLSRQAPNKCAAANRRYASPHGCGGNSHAPFTLNPARQRRSLSLGVMLLAVYVMVRKLAVKILDKEKIT